MAEFSRDSASVGRITPSHETRRALEYAPETTRPVEYDRLPWIKERNAKAGVFENRWAHENPDKLRSFRGTWVAILGDRILKSGEDVTEVYAFLNSQGYSDALVLKVPSGQGKRPYLIA
jgi:hypothetical protein